MDVRPGPPDDGLTRRRPRLSTQPGRLHADDDRLLTSGSSIRPVVHWSVLVEPWGLLVREGSQALLEGRFQECARLAARAAELAPAEAGPGLLAVAALREQGRAAEAELLARDVAAAHPANAGGQALLGAVLADLGRDAEARRQLERAAGDASAGPEVAVLGAEIAAALNLPGPAQALHRELAARAGELLPVTGAVARHLGLLCHVLGRWDEAGCHFEAALQQNEAAGAPVLAAHTRRQHAALLRSRGDDGDWERAIDLLAAAASVYRRLEIDGLAEASEAVLRRSQHTGGDPAQPVVHTFRPLAGGWELAYDGRSATVADGPGIRHLATLLAAEGRPVHVVDLALGPDGRRAGAGDRPTTPADLLGDQIRAEYQERLAELGRQLERRAGPGRADPVAASLARAERDVLRSELAALTAAGGDHTSRRPGTRSPDIAVLHAGAGERARRLVALRIRIALDRIDEVLPAMAHHLRRAVRTGTFCLYEPEQPLRWKMGP